MSILLVVKTEEGEVAIHDWMLSHFLRIFYNPTLNVTSPLLPMSSSINELWPVHLPRLLAA